MARSRYSRESAPQRASKYNLWIRMDKRTWYTVSEFRFKFGEDPQSIEETRIELLNPFPFINVGRNLVRQKIQEGKSREEILLALDKLDAFIDKLMTNQYKPLPHQENTIPWPDRVFPDLPKLPEPDHPDYNDLSNERTELANEIAKQKALDLEEEMKRRRDKFTARHLRR